MKRELWKSSENLYQFVLLGHHGRRAFKAYYFGSGLYLGLAERVIRFINGFVIPGYQHVIYTSIFVLSLTLDVE